MRSGSLPGHVCHHDGQLVGYCFGERDTGEIIVLALLPEFEGLGLGKTLLELVITELRAQGHQRLFLGCSRDPASRSYGFYRYLGWTATGETDKYGDDVLSSCSMTIKGRRRPVMRSPSLFPQPLALYYDDIGIVATAIPLLSKKLL